MASICDKRTHVLTSSCAFVLRSGNYAFLPAIKVRNGFEFSTNNRDLDDSYATMLNLQ